MFITYALTSIGIALIVDALMPVAFHGSTKYLILNPVESGNLYSAILADVQVKKCQYFL